MNRLSEREGHTDNNEPRNVRTDLNMYAKTGQIQTLYLQKYSELFQLNWLIWKEDNLYNVTTEENVAVKLTIF